MDQNISIFVLFEVQDYNVVIFVLSVMCFLLLFFFVFVMFRYTPVLEFTFGSLSKLPVTASNREKTSNSFFFSLVHGEFGVRLLIPVISLNCEEAKEKNGG